MSANELALKFGTHQPETVLAALPLDEATEIIKQHLRQEVRSDLECEFEERISDAEEEATGWENRAEEYECDATNLAEAIRKALESGSVEDMKVILERARADYRSYF